jgi:hypothetical protein
MTVPFITPVMTLPEYLKGSDIDDSSRPYVEMFAASSDIMGVIPFEGLMGATYDGFRQTGLPNSMGFRAINAPSTSGAGVLTPFQEATYVIDHDIPVDRAVVRRGGDRRRAIEEKGGIARLGELWVNTFLKGDNTQNAKVFNGLQKRAAKFGRTIDNSNGAAGGAALSLSQLDWAIQNTHEPTHIIIPWAMRYRFIAAARNTSIAGFVIQTWDGVGAPKMTYAGLPLLFGYEKDLHPPILPFAEVAIGGGAPVTSSIYVVSFKEGGVRAIQIAPIEVRDMGLLEDGITYNTHISWDVGLVDEHQFCFTRLSGVTNASIVA